MIFALLGFHSVKGHTGRKLKWYDSWYHDSFLKIGGATKKIEF